MTCPTFVGRTQTTLGVSGPLPNASASEVLWGGFGDNTVYRYGYPVDGSPEIEFFGLPALAGGLAPDDDGSLWWISTAGDVYRRAVPTSAGSDSLIAALGGSRWVMLRSNHDGNFYCVRCEAGQPPIVWRVTPAGVATLLLTGSIGWGSSYPTTTAAGESLWFGVYDGAMKLWQYHIPTNALTMAATPSGGTAVASDNAGRCIYNTGGSLSIIDEALSPVVLDCPDLAGGSLQGGFEVPGSPAKAVMSHYIGYTGDPDGDWIWEWGAAPARWSFGHIGWRG